LNNGGFRCAQSFLFLFLELTRWRRTLNIQYSIDNIQSFEDRENAMEFNERTIKVIIDDEKCEGCKTHACVEACKTYSRGILVLKDGKPAVEGSPEELARKGTECLACEYECWFRGNSAITIEVPIEGLVDYRKKHGTQ
jgi:ferredoxin